ncbi:hypothetical protein EYW49_20590 [Siculibacillus lacustris]|uniref:Uncharacterized protein n=1 Tax=Siculibacillus lacustris TaxID=1549641 RepID=A0A4Q9VGX2_9HYPH|nr:hypothetical protein [Siculibacillus lacustris]TBW33360.1 hypothetical protein EYW49_20590 [Siculibacillus lacustris]
MTDQTIPDAAPAPAAPVLTFVRRHPSYATLDVILENGTPMPDAGAEIDLSQPGWASLLERDILVTVPAK